MEESSESHMETDVSSTTEDVPETQEVSGSNTNVEMVVIVEEVNENDNNSSSLHGAMQSRSERPIDNSLSLEISPDNTPITAEVSPINAKDISQSILSDVHKSGRSSSEKDNTPTSIKLYEQIVDSSSKTKVLNTPEKSITPAKKLVSPIKINLTPPKVIISIEATSPELSNPHFSSPKNMSPNSNVPETNSPHQNHVLQEVITSQTLPPNKINYPSKIITPVKSSTPPNINHIMKKELIEEVSIPCKGVLESNTHLEANEIITIHDQDEDNISKKINLPVPKNYTCPVEIVIDDDSSSLSQAEITCETEKEHNKSISRELKSLINSAKESKIISECTQLTSKTRKSRTPIDTPNTSLNLSVDAGKIKVKRRSSVNSQQSNCSEKSDRIAVKRSMRSQNPEFVNKVKQFLNSVTSRVRKESDEGTDDDVEEVKIKQNKKDSLSNSLSKKRKVAEVPIQELGNLQSDPYCWRCHWVVDYTPNEKTHPPVSCNICPRTYHYKCLNGAERTKLNNNGKEWVCIECMAILHAENPLTRSPAKKKLSLGKLSELLNYALNRLMNLNGMEPFMQPVDKTMFPDYEKYVIRPMDLSLMKKNVESNVYGSTVAFLADAQWIVHNSIIFNTCEQTFVQSKLTAAARTLVRSCRAEMGEIEACSECYAAANEQRPTWFTDVCSTPHILLWAKLKGFPYWPAKAMSVNSGGLVDVRFFGAHDRAWVPAKDCFLYSEKDPNNFRTKRQDILESMQEAEHHIRNISRKYGKFVYPPFKTQFDPTKLKEQIKMFIPTFDGEVRSLLKEKQLNTSPSTKENSRSFSKKPKNVLHDGDTSDNEEHSVTRSRKIADSAEITIEDETSVDKNSIIEVDSSVHQLKHEKYRKRRRSEMEEAVFTVLETSSSHKKRRGESSNETLNMSRRSSICTESPKYQHGAPKDTLKHKDSDSSNILSDKSTHKLHPIKLVISTKSNISTVVTKPYSPELKKERLTPIKLKQTKLDKSITINKHKIKNERSRSHRRRSSKSHRHSSSGSSTHTSRSDRSVETKTYEIVPKIKSKELASIKNNEDSENSMSDLLNTTVKGSTEEIIQFDDDTSLAVLARKSKNNVTDDDLVGMPTISSVCSLSTTAFNTTPTTTKTTSIRKSIEVPVDPNSSIIIPNSADNVKSQRDIANKLQKLRTDTDQSLVGKVGVRAFARMTSPEPPAITNSNNDMHVEIKAEPIDVDDADRQLEKMDLMNAFRLKPVNSPLRDVRINKVVLAPVNAKKCTAKPSEPKPRARKTFPQPKKDDGRSELNCKNSMVYIPIQPPATPGPIRPARIATVPVSNGPITSISKSIPMIISSTNSMVNTVTTFVPTSIPTVSTSNSAPVLSSSITPLSTIGIIPSGGQLTSVGPLNNFGLNSPITNLGPMTNLGPIGNLSTIPNFNQISNLGTMSNIVQTTVPVSNMSSTIASAIPGQLSTITSMSNPGQISNVGQISTVGQVSSFGASVGQVPTTVHTVPLITSVNGQWTFSLQPIMSVGGLDDDPPSSIINGLPDRSNHQPGILPVVATNVPTQSNNLIVPGPNIIQPAIQPTTSVANISNIIATTTSATPTSAPATSSNNTLDTTATHVDILPRLQHKPIYTPLNPKFPVGAVPTPCSAGPVTAKFNQNSTKMMEFFRTLLEETLEAVEDPGATVTSLQLQLERAGWRHRQELNEMKHNHELTLLEMRMAFEKEKQRIIAEERLNMQAEIEKAVKQTKQKQWCANCNQEAQFYCCWNTSYCNHSCQRVHWTKHFAVCSHQRQEGEIRDLNNPPECRSRPHPDNIAQRTLLPSTPAPTLTVGGKVTTREPVKSSIIMCKEQDSSGNSKLKCLGTYNAPSMPHVLPNQQVPISDDATKKIVTSGGYLILGGTTNGAHSIRYF